MMNKEIYTFKAKAWLYPGKAGWYFLSVPKGMSREITKRYDGLARGWGSFKVTASIGDIEWKTSIFPEKKSETFLLPLKAEVRKKAGIIPGKTISCSIVISI